MGSPCCNTNQTGHITAFSGVKIQYYFLNKIDFREKKQNAFPVGGADDLTVWKYYLNQFALQCWQMVGKVVDYFNVIIHVFCFRD